MAYSLSSTNKRANNTYTETSKYDCNNEFVSWTSDPKGSFGWSLKVTLVCENVVRSVNHHCRYKATRNERVLKERDVQWEKKLDI